MLIKSQGDYINGRFVRGGAKGQEKITLSPGDLKDQVFSLCFNPQNVARAVLSAQKAYPLWSGLLQEQRNQYLLKLAQIYREQESEVAELISRETGKPLWESTAEAKALSQKVEITLKKALPLVQEGPLLRGTKGTKERLMYRSKGVFAVLGPFNFPAHLANGHIIPALAVGNTVIFKPSDKAPAVGEKLAQLVHLAGFPKGVFNMVQGGGDIGSALALQKKVDGVLFTGSYAVGLELKKAILDQPHKILALEMGGKNSALVWKDADIDRAVSEILKAAYWTCGQRCSATSRILLHKSIAPQFLDKFIQKSKALSIGHWSEDPFMGPLIDKKAVLRFQQAQREAKKTGSVLLEGRQLDLNGYYVSPCIVQPKAFKPQDFYQNEELFVPLVKVYIVSEQEQALNLIHQGGYGLCLSVFSRDKMFAKSMCQRAQVGVFHWNLSSNGASSHLPFGGLGKSGNDRPAGLFAIYSCVTPVAFRQLD